MSNEFNQMFFDYSGTSTVEESIHPKNNLYPIDITMAPVNRPMKPEKMNPPITPIKITSIGTGAPLPNKIGFKTLSDSPAMSSNTVQMAAGMNSFVANI